jgi:hypothetical protein
MEKSLFTLEEMAGEIGASVIVVKEVEVPDVLVKLAEEAVQKTMAASIQSAQELERAFPNLVDDDTTWSSGLGAWDRRSKRASLPPSTESPSSFTDGGFTTGTDTEGFTTDDDPTGNVKTYNALDFDDLLALSPHNEDDGLDTAVFAFDPEPSPALEEPPNLLDEPDADPANNLSISSVYKPRTTRRRPPTPLDSKIDRRRAKMEKQGKLSLLGGTSVAPSSPSAAEPLLGKGERRRLARDRRREHKRQAFLSAISSATAFTPSIAALPAHAGDGSLFGAGLALNALRLDEPPGAGVSEGPGVAAALSTAVVETVEVSQDMASSREPRLIVEALVVRKLSVGAAYRDFGFRFEIETEDSTDLSRIVVEL